MSDNITLTEKDFEALVVKINEEAAKLRGFKIDWTDELKGQLTELVQDEVQKQTDARFRNEKGLKFLGEDKTGGFNSLAEFAYEVFKSGENISKPTPKLKVWNDKVSSMEKAIGSPAQSAGDTEAGGALIPTEYANNVMVRMTEKSPIMQKATVIPMQTDTIDIPYIKDFDRSQKKVAGNVSFEWVAETTDRGTGKTISTGLITLKLREASAMVYIPERLIKFSPISIQPFVNIALDQAMVLSISDAFISGTGAGQPLGVLNAPCLVTIAKETGQAADTIEYANILKMFARHDGLIAEWYANKTTIPELGQMTLPGGTSAVPVFLPTGGASATPYDSLMGRPLYWSEYCSVLGDAGDIILCDWSQYLVGKFATGPDMEVAESIHLKFDFNQRAFRFTFYIDGQPWVKEQIKPVKGNSISPFVTIAARS